MKKSVVIACFLFVGVFTTQTVFSQSEKPDNMLVEELISKKEALIKSLVTALEFSYTTGLR